MKKANKDFISIIYNQNNDSPKYFELKKSKVLFFIVGLPTITLIAVILGAIGLIHTSPFHLLDNYRQNTKTREAEARANAYIKHMQKNEEEKLALTKKLSDLQEKLNKALLPKSDSAVVNAAPIGTSSHLNPVQSSIGLSTLSFFKPIQGQKDKTKPTTLALSGFKTISTKETVNLQFNIIPAAGGEAKLSGHIIVLMKNELAIEVYPQQALNSPGTQVDYSSGETFATQRFRPVEAVFYKPKKAGNYIFTVYIFAKNGDLLHYQSVQLLVKF